VLRPPRFTLQLLVTCMPGLINASGQLVYNPESDGQRRWRVLCVKWLSMEGNDQWLLIFDNLDDMEVIDRAKHFPRSSSGT